MAIVPLGNERFIDTSTGKTFSTTGGGYFSGGSSTTISVPAVAMVPAASPQTARAAQLEVKAATPDLIQITEEGMAIEVITELLFEDIGGTEILNISRHDLINGIDVKYQQISNLAKIESTFGGSSLINMQNSIEQIFNRFALKRYQYVPTSSEDPSGLNNHLYVDLDGNINIELSNLEDNMQIEIEFKAADSTDIIY
jgi:hypothetical protein